MAELQADGVLEEAEGNICQQLMAAAQLARSAVQARQDAAQWATRRDLEEARQLQAQLDAQKVAARAELAPVDESSWRDQTQVRAVARAYETAVTFRDEDQATGDAESRIRQDLRDRYDVEVLETGADPVVVRATLADRATERADRDERHAQARDDQDRAADIGDDAELSWDSADWRELHVAGIEAASDRATAATAWKQDDVDQARPPRDAVKGARPNSSRPKTPMAASGLQIGLER
ncbi:hypothetical protein E3T24_13830 [Cryobacterium sp. TmT2-59]|uniref:Uncharacterized protein n=1 Tax=Cryobacterium shii TaxID=1259235 RepID=A0AAQ2C7Q9_9MICO|nr:MULTISPECIES: hypothetical protein [Cryobacterium]TFC50487.1 hypothetical protein E3O49_04800 [Cryobacterium shii]TFC82126.1 hypothetical protein E3T24_13830 [Cryobacterium sp. TmT2-59]